MAIQPVPVARQLAGVRREKRVEAVSTTVAEANVRRRCMSWKATRRARPFVGVLRAAGIIDPAALGLEEPRAEELQLVRLGGESVLAVGDEVRLQVLFRGEAVCGGRVTVIPSGRRLPPYGTPNPWDLAGDGEGIVTYRFTEPGSHLFVAYLEEDGTRDLRIPYSFALAIAVDSGGKDQEVETREGEKEKVKRREVA